MDCQRCFRHESLAWIKIELLQDYAVNKPLAIYAESEIIIIGKLKITYY